MTCPNSLRPPPVITTGSTHGFYEEDPASVAAGSEADLTSNGETAKPDQRDEAEVVAEKAEGKRR